MRRLLSTITIMLFSICSFAADTVTYGIKYNNTDAKNEVWRANADGTETLLKQFEFPSGGWQPSLSFADDATGKLYLRDSGAGITDAEKGWVVYDPATNTITTAVKEGYMDGFQKTFESVLKIDDLIKNDVDTSGDSTSVIGSDSLVGKSGASIIASGTDATDGTATTVIGSNDIVGADGDTLISKESDGSVHIGENSLITVESNGQQQLYAQDASDAAIDINVSNGSDLLVNGVSVSNSLTTVASNTAAIGTNTASIAANTTAIGTNTASIAANTTAISNMKADYSSGIASAVAMSQFEIADEGISIGVGHGSYNSQDEIAFGLGYGGQFKNGTRFKLRGSKSGDASGIGLSISF